MLGGRPLDVRVSRKAERLAERDRRDTELRTLHRGGDGAGIGDVVGDVLAAIDAGEHEIRLLVLHDVADRHQHAIGRRTSHRIFAGSELAYAERVRERERMRGTALLFLGRDDPDVARKLAGDLFERLQAGRMNAVIVRDQDTHGFT